MPTISQTELQDRIAAHERAVAAAAECPWNHGLQAEVAEAWTDVLAMQNALQQAEAETERQMALATCAQAASLARRQAETERQMALATCVKAARMAAGLTQEELGKAAGVSRASINELEGGSANPSMHTLLRVASACNVLVHWLFWTAEQLQVVHDRKHEACGSAHCGWTLRTDFTAGALRVEMRLPAALLTDGVELIAGLVDDKRRPLTPRARSAAAIGWMLLPCRRGRGICAALHLAALEEA